MRSLLLILALGALPAFAQTPGTCAHGTATGRLNVGDVDAGLFVNGNLFFDRTGADDYTVAGGPGLFAANFWVGGTVNGEVRVAAATFNDFEFWPGPLNAGGSLPAEGCAPYDRIWVVTAADIAAYEATGTTTLDLATWPVGLGAEAVVGGAPVVATSRAQTIDLAAGERPAVVGSQTAFWVMNDIGNVHESSGSVPLGIEVQVTAAAFDGASAALDRSTLYRFRIVNRSENPIRDARATLWVDTDLGALVDEQQGVDVARGMAFTYNAQATDPIFGVPPAMGYDFLATGLGAHRYALNAAAGPFRDPRTASEIFATQHGRWNDSSPVVTCERGYGCAGAETAFSFPADPVAGLFWSEENADGAGTSNSGGNKRSIPSTPSFTLAPGKEMDVVVALLFGQGADRLDSITQLRAASDAVQSAYDRGVLFPVAVGDGAPSPTALALTVPRPNPTTGAAEVTFSLPEAGDALVRVVDVLGRTVTVVHAGPLAAGATALRLSAGLAPGVYTVVAESGDVRAVQRLTVMR